jgi:hypothetical protein
VRNSIRLVSVAAAATAACILGPAGPVAAQEHVQHDRRDDLSRIPWDTDLSVPAPGRRYADVVRTRFAHRDDQAVVRSSFVELARAETLFAGVETRTPGGRETFTIMATGRDRAGFLFQAKKHACRVDVRIDYVDNTLRVAIPRSCLGDPGWVQLRFGASVMQRDGDEIIDNSGASRFTNRSPHPWSPRLRTS